MPSDREKKKDDPHTAAADGKCRDDSDLSNPANVNVILAEEAAWGATGVPFIDTSDPRHKDDHTLFVNAKVLHAAVSNRDTDRLLRLLPSLSESDRKEVVAKFVSHFAHGDKDALYVALNKFAAEDRTKILTALNTSDGRTNISGWLWYQMERARLGAALDANVQILQTLSMLKKSIVDDGMKQFPRQDRMGRDFLHALRQLDEIDPVVREAVPILLRGTDGLSFQDRITLASLALDKQVAANGRSKDKRLSALDEIAVQLFCIALRGPSHAAAETRQQVRKDSRLKFFGDEQRISQAINGGTLRLKIIADAQDTNPQKMEAAVIAAGEEERDILERGWKLYHGYAIPRPEFKDGKVVDSPEDLRARQHYMETYFALMKYGSLEQLAIWQDELFFPGGSMATRLAEMHGDEYTFLQSADYISELDWKELKSPKTRDEFRGYIEESMKGYCIDDVHNIAKVMSVVDAKASTKTFEESKQVMSPLTVRLGGARNGKEVAQAISTLTAADVQKIMSDPETKRLLDDAAERLKDDVVASYAVKVLIEQLMENRKPVRLGDLSSAERLAFHVVSAAADEVVYKDLLAVMRDDTKLREQLKSVDDTFYPTAGGPTPLFACACSVWRRLAAALEAMNAYQVIEYLLENGTVPLDYLLRLGFAKADIFSHLHEAPKGEQDAVMRLVTPEELKIVADVLERRRMTPHNRLFLSIVEKKDIGQVIDTIKRMRRSEVAELEREYARRFERSLADDVVGAAPKKDQQNFQRAFAPEGVTPGQPQWTTRDLVHFSDNPEQARDDVLQRAVEGQSVELQTAERKPVNIPRDQIERLAKRVETAIQDYMLSSASSSNGDVERFRKLLMQGVDLGGDAVDVAATYGGAMSFAPPVVAMAIGGDPEDVEPWLTTFAGGDGGGAAIALYTNGVRATTIARFAKVLSKVAGDDLKRGADEKLKERLPGVFDETEESARRFSWTVEQTRDRLKTRLSGIIQDLTITSADPELVAAKMLSSKAMKKMIRFLSSANSVRALCDAFGKSKTNIQLPDDTVQQVMQSNLIPEDLIYIAAASTMPEAAIIRARLRRR